MSHLQYLFLLILCVLFTLPLEFIYGFRVWRAPKRLLRALTPGLGLFSVWDLVAIHRGYWQFSQKYTLGWKIFGILPIEEALFFFIVPAAAVSGFEAVRAGLSQREHG